MANIDELSYTGLQTKDNTTLVNELIAGFNDIYSVNGEELNLDSNTPDGQLIELISMLGSSIREIITEVYNSCDPDKCVGSVQDNRYQINYLTRKAGSYTLQNITITTNKTVTLQGLDSSYNEPEASAFTISDDNGNIWYLIDTTTLLSGINTLEFRAKEQGVVVPTIGTIVNPVTIVDGVISVINNIGPTSIGTEEESDSDFRIRRARSVANASENNIDTMVGNLEALEGVVAVNVHMNNTSTTDSTGTLPHYIWVIVEGGANTDIANIIYTNMAGSGTRGSVTVPVTSKSLQQFDIHFDRETVLPLYIKFDLKPISDLGEINQSNIKTYIATNLTYSIGENVETSKVTQVCADAMLADGGNGYALNIQVSKGGTATADISTSTGITSASVISSTFQDIIGDTTDTYDFMYDGTNWKLENNVVEIDDYGISYEGTPEDGDIIMIDYTAGTWTDYLAVNTIADKYTTDYNKIYINPIEE